MSSFKLPAYTVIKVGDRYGYEGQIYNSQQEIWQARQKQISENNRYKGE